MGLKEYKSSRCRFTWKHRYVRDDGATPVLGPCKNQREDRKSGRCSYYTISNVIGAHQRLNSVEGLEISIDELDNEVTDLRNDPRLPRKSLVTTAFKLLQSKGAPTVDPEVRYRVKYHAMDMTDSEGLDWMLVKYMRKGPMVGVFGVCGRDMIEYGKTEGDEIYIDSAKQQVATHFITLSGFGVQATCPFWHFQNSYGDEWRGAARGYGQLFAIDLLELYGFELVSAQLMLVGVEISSVVASLVSTWLNCLLGHELSNMHSVDLF